MNHMPESTDASAPRDPSVSRRRWRISLVWLVPLVAAGIGISMVLHTWLSAGPQITISFETASGLEAGKTLVKFKDVAVGIVSAIALSDDQTHVVATVALDKRVKNFARSGTRFWIVRPRVGSGGVSGLDTLLSGAYIGVDKGDSTVPQKKFVGLESPPVVISSEPGKTFILHSPDLGSLNVGAPVYYRRMEVGRVASFQLAPDGRGLSVQVFVDAPYDRFVTTATRFWNASGLDVSLSADGFKVNTQSLATVVAGGIAFATPYAGAHSAPAPDHASFALDKDEQTAMAPPNGQPLYLELRFDQPLRGLEVNAPVEFFGMNIGHVVSVNLDYDPAKRRFPTVVGVVVYPHRLAGIREKLPKLSGDEQQQDALFLRLMVEQGLRAQARTGNLLTGQLYIAVDIVPNAPKADFDINAKPLMIPTVGGSLDKLQEQISSIVDKLQKMPLDAIGRHLDDDLVELNKTLKQVNGSVLPATRSTLRQAQGTFGAASSVLAEDSPLQQGIGQTLQELQRTAVSLRALTDMLGQHPQSLLRGLPADPTPAPTPAKQANDVPEPPR